MEPKLIIESTTQGVESILVRVPKGKRTEGLAILNRIWPSIQALNKAIHDESRRTKEANS